MLFNVEQVEMGHEILRYADDITIYGRIGSLRLVGGIKKQALILVNQYLMIRNMVGACIFEQSITELLQNNKYIILR